MTWQPEHLTRTQMAERRSEGIRLLEGGKTSQAEIARQLGVSPAAVSMCAKKLRQGKKSLQASISSGRPSKLSAEQKARLAQTLQAGAMAAGFATERWTQARVRQVIKREFGVNYHPNYISRVLHGLGWSVQKPETRAIERDEALIRAWLNQDWPRIKKGAAARRGHRV